MRFFKKNWRFFWICNIFIVMPIQGAPLKELTDAMAPGTWIKPVTQGLTWDLVYAQTASYHILEYSDNAVWDPVTEQLLFVGGGHTGIVKHIVYDAKANDWLELSQPSWYGGGTSHAYDHTAINPAAREMYHRSFHGRDIYIYHLDNKSWSTMSSSNDLSTGECCAGIDYFPEMGGLIYVTAGKVQFHKITSGSWSTLASGLAMGNYHNIAEYNPVHKVILFGGGYSGDRSLYKLDASGNVTKLGDAPFDFEIKFTVITVDPVTGIYLVVNNARELYGFDITTDTWTKLFPFLPFKTFGAVATPAGNYGVTLFLTTERNVNPQLFVYKHAAQNTSVEKSLPRARTIGITAHPNPFGGNILISLERTGFRKIDSKKLSAKIYDINGKQVGDISKGFRSSLTAIWHAEKMPPEIYFIRVSLAGQSFSRKLFLKK